MFQRSLLTICFIAMVSMLPAQNVQTTVTQPFKATSSIDQFHTFKSGDSVTIIGYKKKGGQYNFAVVTDNYAEVFSLQTIPFDITEKALKKLPNALSDETRNTLKQKRAEIIAFRHAARKQEALDGKIRVVIPKKESSYSSNDHYFFSDSDALGNIEAGDTVVILGYTHTSTYHKFALYSNKAAGVYYTISTNQPFEKKLNVEYLPSIDDTDVRIIIQQKKNEMRQREADEKARFRAEVLAGNYKGRLSYTSELRTENYEQCPFAYGDTVSILGYKNKDYYNYFALASEKGAGIYRTHSSVTSIFRNTINIALLPSTDSPEVQAAIERHRVIADSLIAEKTRKLQEETIEIKKKILEDIKIYDPVVIRVTNWSTNSVGMVAVDITVTNGSPTETIKYISFQAYFTNPVGDKVRNEISGGSFWKARGVGPIGPRPTTLENFDERWAEFRGSYSFDSSSFYASTAQYIHLSSVTIQYMSGKTITLTGEKLKKRVIYGSD